MSIVRRRRRHGSTSHNGRYTTFPGRRRSGLSCLRRSAAKHCSRRIRIVRWTNWSPPYMSNGMTVRRRPSPTTTLKTSLLQIRPGMFAHASGALWLDEIRTLIAADVHLGYGWALRRRGQLGPVGDDKVCQKLISVVKELAPEEIVFLGDLVHAPRPAP